MKSNSELQQDVQNAIRSERFMHSTEIAKRAGTGNIGIGNGNAFQKNDTQIDEKVLKGWEVNWNANNLSATENDLAIIY